MTIEAFWNYLFSYAAYLLGAFIYILDEIKKYQQIAETSSDPNVTYKKKSFWKKEMISVIQIALYGIVSMIILPRLFGGQTINIMNDEDKVMYSVPMKAALIPIQIIIGWTGGRAVLALLGKSKKELYKKVGIDEKE